MSVALTNEGPVTFTLDSRLTESTSAVSGTSTPLSEGETSKGRKGTKVAEKALRKAAWEAAKKETGDTGEGSKGEPSLGEEKAGTKEGGSGSENREG